MSYTKYLTKTNLIIALCIALTAVILFTCNCNKPTAPPKVEVKQLQATVKEAVKTAQINIDSILLENKAVKKSLKEVTSKLQFYMAISKEKREALKSDTSEAVKDLVVSSYFSDSLCAETITLKDKQILNLENIASEKDTLIKKITIVANTATNALSDEQKYSRKLEKQLKRAQGGRFFYKLAAGAVAIALIIKSIN